jgi:DNA helicase-2/ATP-dependent DNA helicase PcrA
VDNFTARVGQRLKTRGLLPHIGYRVRTLHGLAHDILRERPGLVGLANNFEIIDERAADRILQDAAQAWLRGNLGALDEFLKDDLSENALHRVHSKDLPELVGSTASAFIAMAKDMQVTPEMAARQLEAMPFPLPLARMGAAIYADYQRALNYRGAVDFDDLIRLALLALESDDKLLERLRRLWPYIL